MWMRIPPVLAALILVSLTGCKPGSREAAAPPPSALALHWLGMRQVQTDPSGTVFKQVWALPATERLKEQTLDKLALALAGDTPASLATNLNPHSLTNAIVLTPAAGWIRPLLDDVVAEETWLEARGTEAGAPAVVLAARISGGRAAVWSTNFAAVAQALSGVAPTATASGWEAAATNGIQYEFARAGEWTLAGRTPGKSALFADVLARVNREQTPVVGGERSLKAAATFGGDGERSLKAAATWEGGAGDSGPWLELSADLGRLGAAFGESWNPPPGAPKIRLTWSGEGTNLQTRGVIEFPRPLPALEPWQPPTNLIHEPLFSFTALRGLASWISPASAWQELQAGPAPDQLYFWAQSGSPFMDYAAALVPNASQAIAGLAETLPPILNAVVASNRMGVVEKSTNFHGLTWTHVPLMTPYLREEILPEGQYLHGGLSPNALTNRPAPPGTIHDLLSRTNLVYFDRETTGPRVEAWMYLSQLGRIVARRHQLPAEAATIEWLRTAGPLLTAADTRITQTGAAEWTLERQSGIGFTAPELHALADWLESPLFPRSMFSLLAKLPPPRALPPGMTRPPPPAPAPPR